MSFREAYSVNVEGRSMAEHYDLFNLGEILELTCGCKVELWKVLTLLAMEVEKDRELRCPFHLVELPYPENFKTLAVNFLQFMRSPEGRELVPDFFISNE